MKKITLVVGPIMFLSGPAFAQAMPASEYVMTAGASDLFERTSSTVVLQTSADPKVQRFAKMMLIAHAKSTATVKAAAARAHVAAPPPKLTPAQAEMIAQLRAETGPARDADYVAQQKAAHSQALAVQQAYARDGSAAPLRQAASMIVPVVQQHIAILKTM